MKQLALERVSKVYETRQGPHTVFEGISFTLEKGRNLGIIGKNGAGKSTMIRLISGAERPTKGRIRWGMSVSWPLAFAGAFAPNLTGLDNLKFIARIYGIEYKPLIPFVEDFTELGSYFREPVMHYSHGMMTRLAFALSMAVEFDCFLIDEAMIVGDVRFHERCHYELFEKRKDRSFILVSHDPGVIKKYCESAVVLNDRHLVTFPDVDSAYRYYMDSVAVKPEDFEHWRM
jgi:capsular polysaccharide transport system ATP-binding protein